VEGSDYGLICGTALELVRRDRRTMHNVSQVRLVEPSPSRDVHPNTKHECHPPHRDVRLAVLGVQCQGALPHLVAFVLRVNSSWDIWYKRQYAMSRTALGPMNFVQQSVLLEIQASTCTIAVSESLYSCASD
jgi:hypothetical protein